MRRTRRAWVLLPCFAAACYTYTPIQSPQPGMEVRARLTGEAAARRSQDLDEPVVRFDGTIVEFTPEALSLDVLVARSSSTFQNVVIRDTVQLTRTEVQSILQRKLSPSRTALFVIGAGAGAAAVVMGIEQVVGGTGDPPDDGTPTFTSRLFSWQTLRFLIGASRGGS